ncbi:putative WRKY transcription factor 41 [Bidens hawaiensis]|uniref:putative WRKY transcription factor 41 n=1 Tax=Bidens hawaiensis TaxID=980011 RepID=UPI00404ACFAB
MDTASCVYEEDKAAIRELTQGLQTAQQLRASPHSPEATDLFIQNILSSYDKALFLLRSSISFGSPGISEEIKFDQPFSSQQGENIISKKRKGSTIREDQVRTYCDNALETDTDDGFSWRKYGQKDIQGAKFPRSYYRCSYRKAQTCFATKQVQRKDEDPKVFDTVYKGKHTCDQVTQSASPQPQPPSPPQVPEKYEATPTHDHQLSPPSPGVTLSNLRANLSVNTSDLDGDSDNIPSLSSFPSTSFGPMEGYHQLYFPNYYDDGLLQGYSPSVFTQLESSHDSFDFLADDENLDFEF